MSAITIKDIKVTVTAPGRSNLVVVKVETSEPELYGLGCATFTQRCKAVVTVIEEYMRPLLIGRPVNNIEDTWQTAIANSYWRNGPIINNAVSGVDEALWDIKGKIAGMPVYELLGGKCRPAARIYSGVGGRDIEELCDNIRRNMEHGIVHNRLEFGYPGRESTIKSPRGVFPYGWYIEPAEYMKASLKMLEDVRKRLGNAPELMIDVHEKLTATEAVSFASAVDPYKLFFLEDILRIEDLDWMPRVREHSVTPMAIGELFNNPNEWKSLVNDRLLDYMRCHISQLGGLTAARKVAIFCECNGIGTIWHGPGDLTPIGMAAQLHLDLASPNFVLQECGTAYEGAIRDVFPDAPELKDGYLWVNDKPGLGVDFNEEEAKKYPYRKPGSVDHWQARLPDGTAIRS